MSLNNIQLTPALLVDLYKESLIENKKEEAAKPAFKFLGDNKKNILILVSKETVAFLEDGELLFLTSVLAACKLSLSDVAIVNQKSLVVSDTYQSLISYFASKSVLLFDVAAQAIDLPFNFPNFQLQQFDQCVYLSAPSLKEIESVKSLKAMLWNCLKNLFCL